MGKYKLFQWIFKKEFEICNDVIIRNRQECDREIDKMKQEIEKGKKQYALVQRIFFLFPSAKIVAVETNKNCEELFVVEKMNTSSLTIYLFGVSYQGITNLPRIESTIIKSEYNKDNYIHIDDIQMQDNEIRNGSIAMEYFLKTAKNLGVDYIDGCLSSKDINNFKRSVPYYKKFGFDVHLNREHTSGGIKKIMR